MKFPAVVIASPAIYRGCSTQKLFWEEKFVPGNMIICGSRNVKKSRDINNGEKYIILDISSKLV